VFSSLYFSVRERRSPPPIMKIPPPLEILVVGGIKLLFSTLRVV